jgi:hypothetical protein
MAVVGGASPNIVAWKAKQCWNNHGNVSIPARLESYDEVLKIICDPVELTGMLAALISSENAKKKKVQKQIGNLICLNVYYRCSCTFESQVVMIERMWLSTIRKKKIVLRQT